jgi:rare lipoprotein A
MQFRGGLAAFTVLLTCAAFDIAVAQSRHQFTGIAAYYSPGYSGRTARGDRYDPAKFTAAHRTLPFGTRLRVSDPRSRRSVIVVVNDRGPFTKGRVLDLSLAAAKALHMTGRGLLRVTAVEEPDAEFTTAITP